MRVLLILFAAVDLGLMIGCAKTSTAPYVADLQIVEQVQPDRNPLLIAVCPDQTPSRHVYGVPQATVSDFEPLLQILKKNGGDLAICPIRDISNRPLKRCHFDEPPVSNAQRPPATGNVFVREKEMRKYALALRDDAAQATAWQKRSEEALSECRSTLTEALAHAPDAPRTDVNGALLRTELLLNEPQNSWSLPPQRYAVIISDGLDNVRGPAPPPLVETKLLIVNSAGTMGSLERFHPLRFESIASAFRFVLNDSQVPKQEEEK